MSHASRLYHAPTALMMRRPLAGALLGEALPFSRLILANQIAKRRANFLGAALQPEPHTQPHASASTGQRAQRADIDLLAVDHASFDEFGLHRGRRQPSQQTDLDPL
jgi:hypothetical protein